MAKVQSISPKTELIKEASQWIAKLDRGMSESDYANLQKWLGQSEQHRLAFMKIAQIWDKSETLNKLADLFPEPIETTIHSSQIARSRSQWQNIAASIFIISLAIGSWLLTEEHLNTSDTSELDAIALSNLESLYKTAIGEHTEISLPDGTILSLNTNTIVRVNYSERQRLLYLDQGEVHVKVAHNKNRPLSLIADKKIVQAVGTAFNVQLSSNNIVELVVTEGRVLVADRVQTDNTEQEQLVKQIILPVQSLSVAQGERILLGEQREQIQPIEKEEINIQLSWQQGNIIFKGETLEEAVREISRYTPVQFVFLDDNLKQVKVAGLFPAGDVEGLLNALSDNFEISSERIDQKVLLSSR